ncbi:MAG: hypothetical protein JW779_14975 [Candidatus Thorarchaeota archaeon]|nr:hypothetical protein [Candidatus Thorarchaeota archaeon]
MDPTDEHPLRIMAFDAAFDPKPKANRIIVFIAPEPHIEMGIDRKKYPLWGYISDGHSFDKVFEEQVNRPIFSIALGDFDGDQSLELAMLEGPGESVLMKRIIVRDDGISLEDIRVDTGMSMKPSMEIQSFDIDRDRRAELMIVQEDGSVKYFQTDEKKTTKDYIRLKPNLIFEGSETSHDVVKTYVDVSNQRNYVVFVAACGDHKAKIRTYYNRVSVTLREMQFENPITGISAKMLSQGGFVAVGVDISGQAQFIYHTGEKTFQWTENLHRIIDCGVFTADLVAIHEEEGEEKLHLALGAGDGDIHLFIVDPHAIAPGREDPGMITELCEIKPEGSMIRNSRRVYLPETEESVIFYHIEDLIKESLQALIVKGSPDALYKTALNLFNGNMSWAAGMETDEVLVRLGNARRMWGEVMKIHPDQIKVQQAKTLTAQIDEIQSRYETDLKENIIDEIDSTEVEVIENVDKGNYQKVINHISRLGSRIRQSASSSHENVSNELDSIFNAHVEKILTLVISKISDVIANCKVLLSKEIDETAFNSMVNTVREGAVVLSYVKDLLSAKLVTGMMDKHRIILDSTFQVYSEYRNKATLKRDTQQEVCESYRKMTLRFDQTIEDAFKILGNSYELDNHLKKIIENKAKDEKVECGKGLIGEVSFEPNFEKIANHGKITFMVRNDAETEIGNIRFIANLIGISASLSPIHLETSYEHVIGGIAPHGTAKIVFDIYGYVSGEIQIEASATYSILMDGTWRETTFGPKIFPFPKISRYIGKRSLTDFISYAAENYDRSVHDVRVMIETTNDRAELREEIEILVDRELSSFNSISLAEVGKSETVKKHLLFPSSPEKTSYIMTTIQIASRGKGLEPWVKGEVYAPSAMKDRIASIFNSIKSYLEGLNESPYRCEGCRSQIRNWSMEGKPLGSYRIDFVISAIRDEAKYPELSRFVQIREDTARIQCPFCGEWNQMKSATIFAHNG